MLCGTGKRYRLSGPIFVRSVCSPPGILQNLWCGFITLFWPAAEGDGRSCPIGQVRNRRLSRFVYRGIYDRPDHDYDMVLEDCKRNLLQMGYLHLSEDGMRIFVDRPLDFLLEGEHERYLSMARETFCLPSAQAPKKSPGRSG